eukprot:1183616-Prorocentrum_minimum.AAC.1
MKLLPLVGHCICVLRNTLCLRQQFRVGALLGRSSVHTMYTHLEDAAGILPFIVSVPRLHLASTLYRRFPS